MEVIRFGINNYFTGNLDHIRCCEAQEHFGGQAINPIKPSALSVAPNVR